MVGMAVKWILMLAMEDLFVMKCMVLEDILAFVNPSYSLNVIIHMFKRRCIIGYGCLMCIYYVCLYSTARSLTLRDPNEVKHIRLCSP